MQSAAPLSVLPRAGAAAVLIGRSERRSLVAAFEAAIVQDRRTSAH